MMEEVDWKEWLLDTKGIYMYIPNRKKEKETRYSDSEKNRYTVLNGMRDTK